MSTESISIGDIRDCTINPEPEAHIGADATNRYQVLPGDVIIAARGTIRKNAVVTEPHRGAVISSNRIGRKL